MSRPQNSLPVSQGEPESPAAAPNLVSRLIGDGEPCGDFDTDHGEDLGGHTLLCQASAPQVRRSLFRR